MICRRASFGLIAAAAASASIALVASPHAYAADGGATGEGTAAPFTLSIEGVGIARVAEVAWPTLVLERGADSEAAVLAWRLHGPADATLVDPYGMPHAKCVLEKFWSPALGSDSLGADDLELSIATLTVVCDGIRRVDP